MSGAAPGAVLVTGGAGFVGSHLVRSLLEDEWQVDVLDDLSSGRLPNVPAGATLVRCDLGRDALDAVVPRRPYAAILHVAGQSSGEKSFDDPLRDHDSNARSTLALAVLALERGIPALVQASSMGVYGQPERLPVAESEPCRPLSWYGAAKLAAEQVLAVAAREGLRTCSLRMFSVYGPGQDMAELRQGMVSIYLAYLLRGEPVPVRGPLDRVRDLVHVSDVVAAWRRALETDASGAFNVGTGAGTSVEELLAALKDACGLPADHPVMVEPRTPGDQTRMIADIARARLELGWAPRVALQDGLAAMVAWGRGG